MQCRILALAGSDRILLGMDLLVATTNAGKVKEFGDLLKNIPLRVRGLRDFPGIAEVPETGDTFRANAVLKAAGYAAATGCWALADDSGLEVDALAGKPGVHSARWASLHQAGAGDAANNALLLRQMAEIPFNQRQARFVCVLALANARGQVVMTARGVFDGWLRHEAVGCNGFGYDPLFAVDASGLSSAQLTAEQKHARSHRGQAVRLLCEMLNRAGALS